MGTNKSKVSDFSDSDEESKSSPARGSKSPTKSMSPNKRRPQAKNQKCRKKIAVFEKMIIQRYLDTPALYMGRKFDIRAFMIILCCKPYFVFSTPAFARVSLEEFTMANFGKKTLSEATGKLSG